METGDGLLARLPPVGPLSAAAFLAICDAARRYGNGRIEVTARGSIQVRGLTASSVAPFTSALAAVGIRDAHPAVLVPPLAGLDSSEAMDVRPLAEALRVAVAGLGPRLSPKASVVIDGGGSLHLGAIAADLGIRVSGDSATFALGGDAANSRLVGTVPLMRTIDAAVTILRLMAQGGTRGRDLDPAAIATTIGVTPCSPTVAPPATDAITVHPLRDGSVAVGVALPFGESDADALAELVRAAPATAFAPAPGHALLAIGLDPADVGRFRDRAAALGFIVDADDPRRAVAACPGAPACASGRMPARAIAAAVAEAAAPMLDGSVTLHVSGCAKGCAHPRAATLALVGTDAGPALAVEGRAEDAMPADLPPGDIVAIVARIAATVAAERRSGETAAATIARLRLVLIREPADA
jgi:precorrin-3B synthase